MKHFYLTALAAGICIFSFAADDWKVYFENNQTKILYRYSDCHDETNGIHQQKVLLKFVNEGSEKKEISFSKELTYSNSSTPVSTDIKIYTLQLQPLETKEGLCAGKDETLFIFSKQLNFKATELKKFELKNISVKSVQ